MNIQRLKQAAIVVFGCLIVTHIQLHGTTTTTFEDKTPPRKTLASTP